MKHSNQSISAAVLEQSINAKVKVRFYDMLRSYTFSKIPNRMEAEDVLRSVFAKITKHYDPTKNFEKNPSFESFAFRICRNEIIDFYREKKSRKNREKIASCSIYSEPCVENSYLHEIDNQENIERSTKISDLLDRLPFQQKEAIALKYWDGYSLRKIARITKTNHNTIMSRIKSAEMNLRRMMEDPEYIPRGTKERKNRR